MHYCYTNIAAKLICLFLSHQKPVADLKMAEELFNRLAQFHKKWQETSDYTVFGVEEKVLFEGMKWSLGGRNAGPGKWPDKLNQLRLRNLCYKQPEDYSRSRPISVKRFISPSQRELSIDKETSSTKGKKPPHPRSVSVDPASKRPLPYIRRFTDLGLLVVPKPSPLPPAPKGLSGKAVPLLGRQLRVGLGRLTARIPLQAHCSNPPAEPDSPIKRNYQQLLRRTLKQIEDENIEGWA